MARGINRPFGSFRISTSSWQARGLVAWWPAIRSQDLRDFSKLTGSFDLTATGPTLTVDPEMGRVWLYNDASTEYFDRTSAAVSATPCTMCAWMKPDATHSGTLVAVGSSSTDDYARIITSTDGKVKAQLQNVGAGGGKNAVGSAYSLNTWEHVTGTFVTATDMNIFLNGVGKVQDTTSIAFPGVSRTSVGRTTRLNPVTYFSGHISDVRIYNRTLSDAEIYALYDSRTRWDLYAPIVSRLLGKAPATYPGYQSASGWF
ncbi:MAG TPA: LamG domain-containing protein [Porticoccus sp.]|nr:LamG domain-containing protein [Porticoccus sp.]